MGPLVGGFAAQYRGWQWTIWELIWLSGFCLVWLFFTFPETSAANILYRRTARLRKLQSENGQKIKCQPEIEAEKMTPSEGLKMTFVKPFTLMLGEPIVFALNLYIALVCKLTPGTITMRSSIHHVWLERNTVKRCFISVYLADA